MTAHDVSGEARDNHGRWTAGANGFHDAGPNMNINDPAQVEKADSMAKLAAETAKQMDFNSKYITVSDEHRTFELNGKTYNYAGAAFLDASHAVVLYTPHINAENVQAVTAHEIEHQKYQAFIDDYAKEKEALFNDPDYKATLPKWEGDKMVHSGRPDNFMRPDGSLHEPFASRYPVYTAWDEANRPSITEGFAKSDGVSGYSRDWWDAWHAQKANTSQAMHETLAEIGRLRYEAKANRAAHDSNVEYIKSHGGQWTSADESKWRAAQQPITHLVRKSNGMMGLRKGIDPIWNTLYKAVDANWKRRDDSYLRQRAKK